MVTREDGPPRSMFCIVNRLARQATRTEMIHGVAIWCHSSTLRCVDKGCCGVCIRPVQSSALVGGEQYRQTVRKYSRAEQTTVNRYDCSWLPTNFECGRVNTRSAFSTHAVASRQSYHQLGIITQNLCIRTNCMLVLALYLLPAHPESSLSPSLELVSLQPLAAIHQPATIN